MHRLPGQSSSNRQRKAVRLALIICACPGLPPAITAAADPPITAIAFAPDGKSVVLASQAGLAVHDWPNLNLVRKLNTTLENIHDMAFSPDGRSLAVAGGTPSEAGMAQIFVWPGGMTSCELHGHDDSALAVAWKNDSSIATASLDHEIVVWDVTTRQPTERLKGHSRGVSNLCFLNGNDVLVSSGLDQNLRVWNSESGMVVRTLNNHTKEVHQLALRPANQGLPMIASVSNDHTVRLWQPTIGRMVRFAQLNATPLAVTWLTDGSLIAVATTDGDVRLIDPDTVEVLETIPAVRGWAYSLAVHPSDNSLLVGGRNGQLKRIIPDTSKR
jgi:WD40 repeat protein